MAKSDVAVVQRWFEEVWNNGREDLMETLLTDDLAAHGIASGTDVMSGVEEFRPFYRQFRSTFPDVVFTIEEAVSDRDIVATRWIARMTHLGDALGPPATGHALTVTGMTFWRIRDGKIAEAWNNWDMMGMMNQMGQATTAAVVERDPT